MEKYKLLLPVIILVCSASHAVQCQTSASAPPGDVLRPGHLGRQTGDLERIIHFYHDLIGTGIRGERDQDRPFFSSPGLIEFANSPKHAEFRAVILPIPGTAAAPGQGSEMAIEAIEFRNIERHQYVHDLQDIGSSHLVLIVRDLDGTLDRLKVEGVPVITTGGSPLDLHGGPDTERRERGVIVRDPDGYPVELIELSPPPVSTAPDDSNILGANISVTVKDLDAAITLYKDLITPNLNTPATPGFFKHETRNTLRNTPGAEYRTGGFVIPGSPVLLEFIQYRTIEQKVITPILQDIGVAHILFMVKDMDIAMTRIRAAGLQTLSLSGGPVFIAPTVQAVFVTDPNHFFVEFMHRAPE